MLYSPFVQENTELVKLQVDRLRRDIEDHNHHYYVLNSPAISDADYDRLFRKLQELEQEHPELSNPISPTQRIGAEPQERFFKVQHSTPMLSLANAFEEDELRAFQKRVSKLLGTDQIEFITELKIDGIAVALTYEKGSFIRAATRGNGLLGEDITTNLRTIRSLPLHLRQGQPQADLVEIRGEAYMPIPALERINKERAEAGKALFANPRNAVAGALRQLNPKITASRPIAFFAYGVGYTERIKFSTQGQVLKQLSDWGFPVNPHYGYQTCISEVIDFCLGWMEKRGSLHYEIDGLVVKVDRLDYQRSLGVATREPRWAVAYKFPGQLATTRLLKIGVNIGRTGALNPYAILEPVQVGGVTVRMATLHNEENIRRKDIRQGDIVVVKRAGDVIPQIVAPVPEKRIGVETRFTYPCRCPVCEAPVSSEVGEAMAYCTNRQCPAQRFESLKHFVGRAAADIRGLGPETLHKLLELKLIEDPADLYSLTSEQVACLPNFEDKSIQNLLHSISQSKSREFTHVLFGLGIRHVGESTAELLTRYFRSIESLAAASEEDVTSVPGVGPEIARSVHNYFQVEANQKLIRKLQRARLQLRTEAGRRSEGRLNGKSYVITGTLSTLSRRQATTLIRRQGGDLASSVSSKTDYLVVGKEPGTKLDQARRLGIQQISEEELRKMVEGNKE